MATDTRLPDILRPAERHDFGTAFRNRRRPDRTLVATALALAALLTFSQLITGGSVEVAGRVSLLIGRTSPESPRAGAAEKATLRRSTPEPRPFVRTGALRVGPAAERCGARVPGGLRL
jgi:hypothetical protein